ncbi:hypothetical protein EXS45_00160 [Candidatus Nomurabacteria bacterium]|nr:hypothetical protein [Candidatus Nomurabacteria bacterium]
MNKIYIKNKKNGYVILELLFYISFFAVLSLVVINSMIIMTHAFRETMIQAELLRSGSIMERMSREIRGSYDLSSDDPSATMGAADPNRTIEFVLSGTDINYLENGVLVGNLNTPNIVVTTLSFTPMTTVKGKAVKMLLTVRSKNDALNRTVNFYNTIVLRGSY